MSEIEASVDARYLSAGANRYAAAADWGEDGLVAFGADNNVCLWNPANANGISQLLSGHTAHVRAVKYLPPHSSQPPATSYLVSGGDDQGLRVWALDRESGVASQSQVLKDAHSAPINCIATLGNSEGASRGLFVTGAADATVKIWSQDRQNGQISPVQTIKTTKGYLPLALALNQLRGQDEDEDAAFILAVGGTTNSIQIFTASAAKGAADADLQFTLQATLPGHENWIRSLDFTREKPLQKDSDILLASASQDKYIRIWRVHKGTALSALNAAGMDISVNALMPGNKIHKIKAGGQGQDNQFCIMFEALLLGHEDWIYTARWAHCASSSSGDNKTSNLQLLSASADNSLSIWQSDPESGIWITVARLGEISREKGATTATGSIGGFWTGLWSPSGNTITTLGRTGSWRRWDYDASEDMWKQNIAVSGHTRAVTGISWSRDGSYLLSTSSDQTTRLHAQWDSKTNNGYKTWHEMSRPQIHGYDLNCIDSLGPSSFVSGADEKLMRVFTKPKAVAKMLSTLTGISTDSSSGGDDPLPDAANMPVLGLSNKAIDVMLDDDADLSAQPGVDTGHSNSDREALDPASMVRKSALEIDHPPFEESLSRHTLWPEVEKLYGHGYEISCLAASHDGSLIASACKATSLNHAVIRLFETKGWTEVRPPLMAHTLTVTRLRFSMPDENGEGGDRYLLSVGRDRQWAVFQRVDGAEKGEEAGAYKLLQANTKGHSRMILDGAWAPPTCEVGGKKCSIFATAGRDKQVKIWVQKESSFELALSVTEDNAVTALDFLNRVQGSAEQQQTQLLFLAVGTEGGKLSVLQLGVDSADGSVSVTKTINVRRELWLPKAVTQLAWRPVEKTKGVGSDEGPDKSRRGDELGIAGEDGSLRIYEFHL
ncbi:Elongator complex protein 2 [Rhypophila sp. PSN 637]